MACQSRGHPDEWWLLQPPLPLRHRQPPLSISVPSPPCCTFRFGLSKENQLFVQAKCPPGCRQYPRSWGVSPEGALGKVGAWRTVPPDWQQDGLCWAVTPSNAIRPQAGPCCAGGTPVWAWPPCLTHFTSMSQIRRQLCPMASSGWQLCGSLPSPRPEGGHHGTKTVRPVPGWALGQAAPLPALGGCCSQAQLGRAGTCPSDSEGAGPPA